MEAKEMGATEMGKYEVRLEDGTVIGSRKATGRAWTHVIAAQVCVGEWRVFSWHGSLELAQARLAAGWGGVERTFPCEPDNFFHVHEVRLIATTEVEG